MKMFNISNLSSVN